MKGLESVAGWIVRNNRTVIIGFLILTILVGSGAAAVTLETSFEEFVGSNANSQANEYVERNFRTGPENTTVAMVIIDRSYHVISQLDMIEQLRFQQRIAADQRVAPTLAERHPPAGIATTIIVVGIQQEAGVSKAEIKPLPADRPSPTQQIRFLNNTSAEELKVLEQESIKLLNERVTGPAGGVYAFVPKYYDAKFNRRADATVIYVYQEGDLSNEELLRSQTAMREIARDTFHSSPEGEVRVYGDGIVNDELDRSTTDSLLLVGPLSLILMLGILLYAYRDLIDVGLAAIGVGLVMVWTFGFMGWVGIEFNQLFISIPVFLTGLAIDYAIHAIMRYREERGTTGEFDPRAVFLGDRSGSGLRPSMRRGIAGIGAAFLLVTITTATGFASGVTSPAEPIQKFGIVAAAGIVSALLVFGAFIPALKIEIDEFLESRGVNRRMSAFGADQRVLNGILGRFVWLADRAPVAVIVLALLATSIGLVGATTVDTTFDQKELHVKDTPAWTKSLPEPFRPGEYRTHESLEFFRAGGFVYKNNIAHLLVRGDVTQPSTLERIARARQTAEASNATVTFGRERVRRLDSLSSPIPSGTGPVLAMQAVANRNASFRETFESADTDDDGVPDRNLAAVYDALYAADADAAETVIHRQDGEYRALRLSLYTNGSQPNQFVASEMRNASAIIDRGDGLTATATGRPIIRADVQQQLFTTILRSFVLTLLIVVVLLIAVYWLTEESASLGIVTVLPVVFATAWILGTMALLGIRFNLLTALITSFTIGMGVDYSIHISERYVQELERMGTMTEALRTSVFGTGGALLGSALTTAGGFGLLVFALLNPLQKFGLITAITIVYAFIASVVVLPSLLVLWTRYVRTDTATVLSAPSPTLRSLPRALQDLLR